MFDNKRGKKNRDKTDRIKDTQSNLSGSDAPQRKRGEGLFSNKFQDVLENLHGSARWASFEEAEAAGLRANPNDEPCVVIGAYRDTSNDGYEKIKYLFHTGPEHVLVYAPTRSGKGVGIIVPTLLTWTASAIVLDIKKENYEQSAGWRHKDLGQKVLKFEPTDPLECSRHNMFAEVRWSTVFEQQDVQNVSITMVESDEKWDHWHATAQELLICIMTDLFYRGVIEDRERLIELEKEKNSDKPDNAKIFELSKPIQGNPGAAADVVSSAVSHVASSLIYDHLVAYPPVRGEKMVQNCPSCNPEGYETVIGLDRDVIMKNKPLKEIVGDDKRYLMHKVSGGDKPPKVEFWCDRCLTDAHRDPTAKPPVWQIQPGWIVDYNFRDDEGNIVKTEKVVSRTHPKVVLNGVSFLSKPEDERGSVRSTLSTRLVLFQDPVIAKNTAYCDWRIRDLMYHDSGVTLYMVFSPNDITRLAPLIRLLVAQIGRTYTAKMEYKNGETLKTWNNRLLMLLDEFPSIGKIELMENLYAYMAGYGIKGMTICQDLTQLKKAYGDKESITSNHHIQISYAPNTIETAEYLSKLVGTTTVTHEKVSYSKQAKFMTTGHDSETRNIEQTQRALLTADEVTRLRGIHVRKDEQGKKVVDGGDMIIKVAGENPILGTRSLFFNDPYWVERARTSNVWSKRMAELGHDHPEVIKAQKITEEEREHAYQDWFTRYRKMVATKPEDMVDDLSLDEAQEFLGDEMLDSGMGLKEALSYVSREAE